MIFRVNANTTDLLKNIEEEEHEGDNQESYDVPWSWTNMEALVKNSFSEGEFSKQGRLNTRVLDEQESLHSRYGSLTSIAVKEEFRMVIKQELDIDKSSHAILDQKIYESSVSDRKNFNLEDYINQSSNIKQGPTVDQSVACLPSSSVQSTIDPSTSKPVPNINEPEVELFEESKTLCTFPECGKLFNGSGKLKEHIKNVHKPLKPCQYCFKEVKNLSGHIKDVHAPKEEVFCPFCAKVYNSKSSLRSHTQIAHTEKDEDVSCHLCPSCGRRFANPYNMKKHLRLVHGNKKQSKVSCDECEKQFPNRAYLQQHKRVSHEEDISSCAQCKGNYKNKRALSRHMRYAHNGNE